MVQYQQRDSRKSPPHRSRSAVHPLSQQHAREESLVGMALRAVRRILSASRRHTLSPSHGRFRETSLPFPAFRPSFTSRRQASWQSNGIVRSPRPVWSCATSNFFGGNFVDGTASRLSRFHKIVRKHPPSDRQKSPTSSLICSSEIFAATRYIPDCRFKVSRSDVVGRRFCFQVANTASLPG